MQRRRMLSVAALGLALCAAGIAIWLTWKVRSVSGVVRDESGRPTEGATVRLRASQHATQTDFDGRFTLTGFPPALKVRVTAWAEGYYIAGRTVWPWDSDVSLALSPYSVTDNEAYSWIVPAVETRSSTEEWFIQTGLSLAATVSFNRVFLPLAERMTLGCRDCHGEMIYDQWAGSAQALGFDNPRFASMYNGTDLSGEHQSPLTRFGFSRDYGRFPLRPDPNQPYYGPGYRLDFPDTAGNCAACHLPAAALAAPYGTDPNAVTGAEAFGSPCDFCHKVADVKLNPETGLPYENMPGVLSLVMMRPSPERQIFFGPYDDVDVGVDTYLPLQRQSQYCAACHSASFWGVPIYQSFAEWFASPYSDPATGQTCQDCHMKPDGVTTNFAPGRGGQERDPNEVFTHTFPGASDEELLQNAVTMDAIAERQGNRIVVRVTITNDLTGHHVPTDSPLRHLILLVQATDGQGQALPLQDGSTIPAWGGVGDPTEGYFAGIPGKIYAKVLQELWTEITPSGAYWNPTHIVSDNRLAAFAADASLYTFAAPSEGQVMVEVTLLFRRAFKELMNQKGWESQDVIMEHAMVLVPSP